MKAMVRGAPRLGAIAAVALLALPAPASAQDLYWEPLKQWTAPKERAAWYAATQGSRLIPKTWLDALEQPGQALPFLDPSYIESFGYLSRGPGQLPVGFAVDEGPDDDLVRTKLRWLPNQKAREPWVGMTCSACHTSQITYNGKVLGIDGGQGMGDFQTFMKDLNFALLRTRTDDGKWSRFAHKVLPGGSAKDQETLKVEFDKLLAWQQAEARINQTDEVYGPGRVDAFGRIYNKVALLLGGADAKGNPPDAPVSIPFIWHAPRRSAVQYNGVAPKTPVKETDFGAIGRNTGEVIGVFGDVVVHPDPSVINGFRSSVKIDGLMGLETTLSHLMPPLWPAELFDSSDKKTQEERRQRGAALYAQHCVSCHELADRDPNPKLLIKVKMNALYPPAQVPEGKDAFPPPPGTDPWMACNAFDYAASSGPLSGFKGALISEGEVIPPQAPVGTLLKVTVVSVLLAKRGDLLKNFFREWMGFQIEPPVEGPAPPAAFPSAASVATVLTEKERRLERCRRVNPYTESGKYMGYTSRPLNGVWATAPFLHNGSVPTIYDLLLPPSQRPKSFALGREYDPVKMGLAKLPENQAAFVFRTTDEAGKPIYGNSNAGHDYGNAALNEEQRYSIIEYLKGL